jgi:hypothetical protein
VSYFTLRTIIFLMETMKDFYSSRTVPPHPLLRSPPGAAICALMSTCRPMGEQGVQKIIMDYSNHFVMAITSAEVKV